MQKFRYKKSIADLCLSLKKKLYLFLFLLRVRAFPCAFAFFRFLAVGVWPSDGRENDPIVRGGGSLCRFGVRQRFGDLHWWLRQKRINRRRKSDDLSSHIFVSLFFVTNTFRLEFCLHIPSQSFDIPLTTHTIIHETNAPETLFRLTHI